MPCRRDSFSPLKPGEFEAFDPLHSHRAFCPWVSPGGRAARPKSSAGDLTRHSLPSTASQSCTHCLHSLWGQSVPIGSHSSARCALADMLSGHADAHSPLSSGHPGFAGQVEGRVGWRWCLDSLIPAPGPEEEAGSGQPADQRTKLLALLRSFG